MNAVSGFRKSAGLAAILAAVVGLIYSVAFVVMQNSLLSALSLMAGGLLSVVALVALFERLGEVNADLAMLGLILGAVGALGSVIHGGYDLANAIHAPGEISAGLADLPNPVDPRGLLTFGVSGLALFVVWALIRRSAGFPRGFAILTFVLATLLVLVYLGRLIILTPTSLLVLIPAALTGFIINPIWYLWLGLQLRRSDDVARAS